MAQKHPLEYAHVFSTEPISLMIVPDSASLDAALVITDKWKPAWNSPVQVLSKELSEYPKPKFERVQHKGIKLRKFTRPSSLISLRSTAVDEATYTLSQENVDWLHTFNRTANPGPPLSEEALESAIVALERACERHFQTMHQEFVSAAPHDKKASSTTTAAATTATAPDTLPPSPWRSVLTRAVYRPRRSGEPVDQPLCCEDLRDRIDVRTLSTSLGLSRVVCAAIVEHWLACRAADGLRPLVALFRKPTISETLLGDRFPLHDVRTVMARGRASLRRAARIADLVVQRELAKRALIQATLNQFTSDALTRIKATDKTHARLVPALHTVLATHSAPLPVPPLPLPPPSPATTASHSATAGHGAGRSASSSKARHRQPAPASSTAHAAVAKAAATGRPRDSTHTSARERTKGIRLTTPAGRATARRRKEENEEEYVVSSDADTDGEDDESEVSEMSDSESEREEEGTESGDSGDEDVSSVSGESESEADSSGGEPMSTDEDSDHSSSGSGSGSGDSADLDTSPPPSRVRGARPPRPARRGVKRKRAHGRSGGGGNRSKGAARASRGKAPGEGRQRAAASTRTSRSRLARLKRAATGHTRTRTLSSPSTPRRGNAAVAGAAAENVGVPASPRPPTRRLKQALQRRATRSRRLLRSSITRTTA